MNAPLIERRIRISSALVGVGLLIQLVSFAVVHPLAFVAFIVIGCPLVAIGLILFLVSLVQLTAIV